MTPLDQKPVTDSTVYRTWLEKVMEVWWVFGGGSCEGLHPLPASLIKGEVQACALDQVVPPTRSSTSPLMGEVGRG
jgi:hypothetical protein